jgi:allantoicase
MDNLGYKRLTVEEFQEHELAGTTYLDLVSESTGGKIIVVSDEFFAKAENLLGVKPPVKYEKVFSETGAVYDGWETRRHNPDPTDWVVVKLGVPAGVVYGIEVDTAHFDGNHAPAVVVYGSSRSTGEWEVLLPKQPCGPSQRHIWVLPNPSKEISYVKLEQIPDGGIARFKLYGRAVPVIPEDPAAVFDLAAGGLVLKDSNGHYSRSANLLLPGRGRNMGDGWETRRSREPGHVDWAIVRLGVPGRIEEILVDTHFYRGNPPTYISVYGVVKSKEGNHEDSAEIRDEEWVPIIDKTPVKKDVVHSFTIEGPKTNIVGEKHFLHPLEGGCLLNSAVDKVYSHIRLVIHPDGGVMRLRAFGRREV